MNVTQSELDDRQREWQKRWDARSPEREAREEQAIDRKLHLSIFAPLVIDLTREEDRLVAALGALRSAETAASANGGMLVFGILGTYGSIASMNHFGWVPGVALLAVVFCGCYWLHRRAAANLDAATVDVANKIHNVGLLLQQWTHRVSDWDVVRLFPTINEHVPLPPIPLRRL